jgi:hypothetical protein
MMVFETSSSACKVLGTGYRKDEGEPQAAATKVQYEHITSYQPSSAATADVVQVGEICRLQNQQLMQHSRMCLLP